MNAVTRQSRTETPRTLAEKVWDAHVVTKGEDGGRDLLFIDLHLIHEVTSPQAFDGLRQASRPVRRPDLTLGTEDHNVPTLGVHTGNLLEIEDKVSRTQVEALRRNCDEFGVKLHPMGDGEQGIVHTVGPQLGASQPGMTIVCGDSHLHPRGLRLHRYGHRHQRGRARPGHPDAAADPVQDHGHRGQRDPAARGHRQGPDPGHHRQDRHRWRPGAHHRVPRRGDP